MKKVFLSPFATFKDAAIYDMNGRQLNAQPDNGIYIQDGQKYIAK